MHIYIYIYNIFKKSQIFALFPIPSKYALKFEFKIKSTKRLKNERIKCKRIKDLNVKS